MTSIFLVLSFLLAFGCSSFDEEAIVEDICECNAELVQINEKIKNKVDSDSQRDVMALFLKAGKVHEQTKKCILGLSNAHGNLTQKEYQLVLKALEKKCKESVESFQESGWYKAPQSK